MTTNVYFSFVDNPSNSMNLVEKLYAPSLPYQIFLPRKGEKVKIDDITYIVNDVIHSLVQNTARKEVTQATVTIFLVKEKKK